MSAEEEKEFVVTPWEVSGIVDYDKLIQEFGTEQISDELYARLERDAKGSHHMLRRRVFFSHRDLNQVLDDYESGKGFFLYTGRGPSGRMHIGHIVAFYFTKWLQDRFKVNLYIQITDDEKFLEERRNLTLEDAHKWSLDNILDIIAVGFDPDRTFIFRDTEFMGRMYNMAIKIARRINYSTVKAVFGFNLQTNIGMLFYPAVQIVPTMLERKRCLIPAAIDQDPYWRVQRDVAEGMGYYKTAAIHSKFIPPLIGFQGKMSTSRPETAIYLDDEPKIVAEKIYKYAFSGGQATIELHRKLGGNPDVDVPFQWLYMFLEEDDSKTEGIAERYRRGELLTGELKEIFIEKLNQFLEKQRQRKDAARDKIKLYMREGKLASQMWEKTL